MQKITDNIKKVLSKKKIKNFEVYLKKNSGMSCEVSGGKLESLESEDVFAVGIRVINQNRLGFSYSTDVSPRALESAIEAACNFSKQAEPDQNNVFAPKEHFPQLDLVDHDPVSSSELLMKAAEIEKATLAVSPKIKEAKYTTASCNRQTVAIFNSSGLDQIAEKTDFYLSVMALAEEGESSESVFESSYSNLWKNLKSKALGEEAAKNALYLLGGQRIPNYRGPILLHPRAISETLEILAPSFFASRIHKKNSFFIGKMGQKIYSKNITFVDDGLMLNQEMTFPFDDEGSPRKKTILIKEGELQGYLYDRYWANKDGVSSTGNAYREEVTFPPQISPTNLYIQPQSLSFEELCRKLHQGLWITEVIGMHTADPISGDFSVAVQGCKISNGQIGPAFRSVSLTGNLHQMLGKVIEVGSDLKFYGQFGAPTLLVDDASVSGSE